MRLELLDNNYNKLVILKSKMYSDIAGETYNEILTEDSKGTSELTLILPLYVTINGVQEENHRWAYIINERLVKYTDDDGTIKYFRIKNTEDIHSSNGILTSNIQCKNISFDLTKKGLSKQIDSTGTATALITEVLLNSGWTVGTVDASFDAKTRKFKNQDQTNIMDMLQKISELFIGYLKFDSNAKTVSLVECIGNVSGQVQFRYKKNLKEIFRQVVSDDLITRLWCYGGNDGTSDTIGISSVNPIKEPFIQNFQYYIDKGELTTAQQGYITQYDIDMTAKNTSINSSLSDISTKQNALIPLESELDTKKLTIQTYNQQITGLTSQRSFYQATDTQYTNLTNEITRLQNLVTYLTSGHSYSATGTVSVSNGSLDVTGTGTLFITDTLNINQYDRLTINGQTKIARFITSDTLLSVSEAYTTSATGQIMSVEIIGINALGTSIQGYYSGIFSDKNLLYGNATSTLTGTVNISSGYSMVTGINTLFITEGLEQYDKVTINGEVKYVVSVDSETSMEVSSNYVSSSTGLTAVANMIDDNIDTCSGGYYKDKRDIENQFAIDLDGFIFEGKFQDNAYISSQNLYDDCVTLLLKNAYPQVTYRLSIIDLSKLTGYELEKISLGDKIYVFDELLGIDVAVIVSKIVKNLESPQNTTVEITNYTTVFQDLFRQLINSSNIMNSNESSFRASSNSVNADGTVKVTSLQDTLDNNKVSIYNGINGDVTFSDLGVITRNPKNPNKLTRIDGGDILFSIDNGQNWDIVYSSDSGLNVTNLLGGNIDLSKVNITNSSGTQFFISDIGLFAKDAINPTTSYCLFNKDGLRATTDNLSSTTFNLTSSGSLSLTGDVILLDSGINSSGSTGSSPRFYAGTSATGMASAPFLVTQGGSLYCEDAIIQGSVSASTGSIGGWLITTSTLQNGTDALLDSANYKASFNNGKAIYGQYATGKYGMKVDNFITNGTDSQMYVGTSYTGSNFKIDLSNGNLTANDVTISGDVILANAGMSSTGVAGTSIRIYAGATAGNMASAPFLVTQDGHLVASDADIGTTQNVTYYVKNTTSFYTTDLIGDDNDLIFVSKISGIEGDYIDVEYIDPATSTTSATATLSGSGTATSHYKITVTLSADASGVITAIASDVKSAIELSTSCNNILLVDNKLSNTGSGVVTSLSLQSLSGYSQGSDSNSGLSTGSAFLTLQHALDIIPWMVNHMIMIYMLDGYYNENISITNHVGFGSVQVRGYNVANSYVYIRNIGCSYNQALIYIYNVNCFLDVVGISSAYCYYVGIDGCKLTFSGYSGITYSRSNGFIYDCTISNKTVNAIGASDNSIITSFYNRGSNNGEGLRAIYTATIGKVMSQPSGIIAEYSAQGGEIR